MRGVSGVAPITDLELSGLLGALHRDAGISKVVIALSGGPDSAALAGLCAVASRLGSFADCIAATVDHGLRPDSANEAAAAGEFAASLGLKHQMLTWSGPKPRTGIQQAAREARYRLLVDYARDQGAGHIATAHTLDDQAETVLMRLAHGSGLHGLAAMAAATPLHDLILLRPLLGVSKARLVASCVARGWTYASDPSNANTAFERVRLRRLQPGLAAAGLTPKRLVTLAARMRRADEALDAQVQGVLAEAWDRTGGVIDALRLAREPEEILLRVFVCLLAEARATNSALPPPRLERIERLASRFALALRTGSAFGSTLGGLRFVLRGEKLQFGPEPARRAAKLNQIRSFDCSRLGNRPLAP